MKQAKRPGKSTADQRVLVESLIATIAQKVTTNTYKATVADLVRLVQLHKEMQDGTEYKEILVQWVESEPKE